MGDEQTLLYRLREAEREYKAAYVAYAALGNFGSGTTVCAAYGLAANKLAAVWEEIDAALDK